MLLRPPCLWTHPKVPWAINHKCCRIEGKIIQTDDNNMTVTYYWVIKDTFAFCAEKLKQIPLGVNYTSDTDSSIQQWQKPEWIIVITNKLKIVWNPWMNNMKIKCTFLTGSVIKMYLKCVKMVKNSYFVICIATIAACHRQCSVFS